MANTATIYNCELELADVDREVYESLHLRLARHPSETLAFMLTRLLAYSLEYTEGIEFTSGVCAGDEPAVLVRDLSGQLQAWIEVGAPSAERLHRGARAADHIALYSHHDPSRWLEKLRGEKIHRREAIQVWGLDSQFIEEASGGLQRRNQIALSRTENILYLDINGNSLSTEIRRHNVPSPKASAD